MIRIDLDFMFGECGDVGDMLVTVVMDHSVTDYWWSLCGNHGDPVLGS